MTHRTGVLYVDANLASRTIDAPTERAIPIYVTFDEALADQTTSTNPARDIARSTGIPFPTSTSSPPDLVPSEVSSTDAKPLSTGAKASIGVSVAISVLVVIAALFFLRRRRAKKIQVAKSAETSTDNNYAKAELPAESKSHTELNNDTSLYEASGLHKPAEAGDTVRAELESDWTGWEAPALLEVELSRAKHVPGASAEQLSNEAETRQAPRT